MAEEDLRQHLARRRGPHNAFNAFFEALGSLTVATSPVALAYVTNETGVVTVAFIVLSTSFILVRASVFRGGPPRGRHAYGPARSTAPGPS